MSEAFDVVVVGFGLAGAVAALEAARAGARTLVLDAAPADQVGGNSLVAGQGVFGSTDHNGLARYLAALRIRVADRYSWAGHAMAVVPYLTSLGIPMAPGKAGGDFVEAPGSEALRRWRLADVREGPIVRRVQKLAVASGVRVRCDARAIGLGHTDRSRFCVAYAQRGRRVTVDARHAVVLATGGQAARRRRASSGTPFALGDALKLARQVGARTFPAGCAGPFYGFRVPGTRSALTPRHLYGLSTPEPRSGVLVSRTDARRLRIPPPHLHGLTKGRSARYVTAQLPPALLVVDDEALGGGPLVEPWPDGHAEGWARRYGEAWSHTNDVEIGRGWVRGLGRESRRRLNLSARGELFALPLEPVVLNTLGGLRCDAAYRVLSGTGAIEGLYAVGEVSSVFGRLYQGSGNLTECVLAGRIAVDSALHGKDPRRS
ncbi:FAD-binding protein [Amycolatopsis sp. OK19-0408]|uniref:FAD-binding protein n=1 Tax=Amycolatopsis iheyensis TaxID=2945988 RepID=A0A9X2NIM5_9PSEU|nr:FAD-binding protein [Amycolatopsis iheyensis]MCR6487202.1 FAD-binding protein [Amycolatopsis iheyensis]